MKRLLFLLLFSFLFSQKLDTIVSDREISLNESIDFTIKLNNIDTNPEVNFDPVLDYFSIISGPNIGSEYKFINGKKSSSRSISWRIIPKRTGKITIPETTTLSQAFKLSIKISKPVCTYFYIDSCRGKVNIMNSDGDKIVYKNSEEYTSPIQNTYKVGNEYLVVTENTIYVISCNTKVQKAA